MKTRFWFTVLLYSFYIVPVFADAKKEIHFVAESSTAWKVEGSHVLYTFNLKNGPEPACLVKMEGHQIDDRNKENYSVPGGTITMSCPGHRHVIKNWNGGEYLSQFFGSVDLQKNGREDLFFMISWGNTAQWTDHYLFNPRIGEVIKYSSMWGHRTGPKEIYEEFSDNFNDPRFRHEAAFLKRLGPWDPTLAP